MNANGKVLHVSTLDKFIPPFIDFVEEHFDDFPTRHVFFITGDIQRHPYRTRANVFQAQRGKKTQWLHFPKLARAMQQADKIMLHGLFSKYVILLLFLMPWVLKKSYWVMWGGDLYIYRLGNRNSISWKLKEFFRRPVIRSMGHLVTYIKGDFQLAEEWYGAKGKYHECFMYTSNLYKELGVSNVEHSVINILVGNSADPGNRHSEIFDKLDSCKNQNIKIYVPLTYGPPDYAQEVVAEGRRRFGVKFQALVEHLPPKKYNEFLGQIDIAIFNHGRQQAMGNIISLLGLGKKVYMRSDVTQWEFFNNHEIAVYDIDNLEITTELDTRLEGNIAKVKKLFSEQTLIRQLSEIFH